jgi:ribonucleoside-diphosphate reductase alpha chain
MVDKTELEILKEKNEAPEWLDDLGFHTLKNGYLLENETPKEMWERVSKASAKYQPNQDWKEYFDLFWKNWFCASTPILCNAGTDRGLTISCFGQYIDDSLDSIFKGFHETAILTKNGGGIGKYYGAVRGRGANIKGNGKSEGIIPWLKIEDSAIVSLSQGSSRRGSEAIYLDINHSDIEEFLEIRKPTGDVNRRCLNLHHAVCIDNNFMDSLALDNKKNKELWQKILEMRFTTGQPYIQYTDNINFQNPECYKKHGLKVSHSQLCNEIMLYSSPEETYVCCLSSMNLVKWHDWKNTNAVKLSLKFLDGILTEFIEKASKIEGMEKAVRFAKRHRALGLGVLGFHSLLQSLNLSFESLQAKLLNTQIFKQLQKDSIESSKELAKEFGEPFYCKGFGVRNTHVNALAPTTSNAIISSNVSQSIEPWTANIFSQKSAKGTFIRKNLQLKSLLNSLGKDNIDTWAEINKNNGSVQKLDFLTKEQKEIFKTAREINQHIIIKLASDRQKFIDQGQSLNLFFDESANPKYIHEVHLEAWKQGLKGLYYMRTESVLKGDSIDYKSVDDCSYCEG